MCTKRITRLAAALLLALALAAQGLGQSSKTSPGGCEARPSKAEESLLVELEILARAEQRAEAMRTKLYDLEMRELYLQSRLEYLDYRMRPDSIQRALAFVGSVRPMDELRDDLRKSLENEKGRVNTELELLASHRERLEAALSRAEEEVERLLQRSGVAQLGDRDRQNP